MNAAFLARFGGAATLSWFPGHMASASDRLVDAVRRADVVVEVRDARVPFSSANGLLDGIQHALGVRRPRVVVFNKCDLANPQMQPRLLRAAEAAGHVGLCLSAGRQSSGGNNGGHVGRLLPLVDAAMKGRTSPFKSIGAIMLVAGIPNVGKSTLINGVRLATQFGDSKGAKTGAAPGVTRQISGAMLVRKVPPLYMLDSPGLLPPRIPDPEAGLRLLLTTALPETFVSWTVQAEYLHFVLSGLLAASSTGIGGSSAAQGGAIGSLTPRRQRYVEALGFPVGTRFDGDAEGAAALLLGVAGLLGARLQGGEPDIEVAARHVVRSFQAGALGRYTLDPLPP